MLIIVDKYGIIILSSLKGNFDMLSKINLKSLIYILLTISVVGLIAWFCIYIYGDYASRQTVLKNNEELIAETIEEPDVKIKQEAYSKDIDANMLRKVDFSKLKAKNKDVNAWLYIPKTKIDSYVMKEPRVGQFLYGSADINKRYSLSGSYLIPAAPLRSDGVASEDAHILILGHKMNEYNGEWMFSNLSSYYKNKKSAEKKKYVYMYYPDRSERWKVWCAYHTHSGDDVYKSPYLFGDDLYKKLLKGAEAKADFIFKNKPDVNTKTLVLSTCNSLSERDLKRFVVIFTPDSVYDYKTKSYMDVSDLREYKKWLVSVDNDLSEKGNRPVTN